MRRVCLRHRPGLSKAGLCYRDTMSAIAGRVLTLILLFAMCAAAGAAERRGGFSPGEPEVLSAPVSPHRNGQAQSVAASRECWRGCEMQCKADFLACGYQFSGAECLAATDRCDRACQRRCRSTGDPLLDWPWPID